MHFIGNDTCLMTFWTGYIEGKIQMSLFKSKTYKSDYVNNRIIIILVFSFLTLFSLHGEHYARCRSVHPDEIMDLQCSALPKISVNDQGLNSKNGKDKQSLPSIEIKISSIFNDCTGKISLVNELPAIQDLKDRLSTLQRYNSWNPSFLLFYFIDLTIFLFCFAFEHF